VSVYLSMYVDRPVGLEEAVPKRAEMADAGCYRTPRGEADRERVGELIIGFELAAGCGLPGSRPATSYLRFPAGYNLERLSDTKQVRLFLRLSPPHDRADNQACQTCFTVHSLLDVTR
jgi:hypothetical protein